jgi:hypothetical protein
VPAARAWCSWNPDRPDDSPLQSPQETVVPAGVPAFLDTAVRNGVWAYDDAWNRAGVDALDGAFGFLLRNDKDIGLDTTDRRLLDATRAGWVRAGFEVYEGDGDRWLRVHPPLTP